MKRPFTIRTYCVEESICWHFSAITEDETPIGSVRLRRLSECTALGLIFALEVNPAHRRKGVAEALEKHLEAHALAHQITQLISTVRRDNFACQLLKQKMGARVASRWHNPRRESNLLLYYKVLMSETDSDTPAHAPASTQGAQESL